MSRTRIYGTRRRVPAAFGMTRGTGHQRAEHAQTPHCLKRPEEHLLEARVHAVPPQSLPNLALVLVPARHSDPSRVPPLEPALPPPPLLRLAPGPVQLLAHWQDVPPVAPIPIFARTFSLLHGSETDEIVDAVPRLTAFIRTSPGLSCLRVCAMAAASRSSRSSSSSSSSDVDATPTPPTPPSLDMHIAQRSSRERLALQQARVAGDAVRANAPGLALAQRRRAAAAVNTGQLPRPRVRKSTGVGHVARGGCGARRRGRVEGLSGPCERGRSGGGTACGKGGRRSGVGERRTWCCQRYALARPASRRILMSFAVICCRYREPSSNLHAFLSSVFMTVCCTSMDSQGLADDRTDTNGRTCSLER